MDESKTKVSYIINVCGKLGTEAPSDCRGIDGVCWNGIALEVNSRTFYYEGEGLSFALTHFLSVEEFSSWIKTTVFVFSLLNSKSFVERVRVLFLTSKEAK